MLYRCIYAILLDLVFVVVRRVWYHYSSLSCRHLCQEDKYWP